MRVLVALWDGDEAAVGGVGTNRRHHPAMVVLEVERAELAGAEGGSHRLRGGRAALARAFPDGRGAKLEPEIRKSLGEVRPQLCGNPLDLRHEREVRLLA